MEDNVSLFDRFNRWMAESFTVKLITIGFLSLILLIPSAAIESLMHERQARAFNVMDEVSAKWSGTQTVAGPVLVIPYTRRETETLAGGEQRVRTWTELSYYLPETLSVSGTTEPEVLHRGIFDVAVYTSELSIRGTFTPPAAESLNIAAADMQWEGAHLVVGVSDLRGIQDNPSVEYGGHALDSEPSDRIGISANDAFTVPKDSEDGIHQVAPRSRSTGIRIPLRLKGQQDFQNAFSIRLSLKGSNQLAFAPVGKTTEVELSGPWSDPSFGGEFLPADREVSESGFSARWKVLHYNRPFSQQWKNEERSLAGYEFGARMMVPAGQYQKSIRTVKYSILIILLSFVSLFLVEVSRKIRIHPFQYALIGAALVIYYTLLISISEYLGYNAAYGIATLASLTLLSLYVSTFLKVTKLVMLFSALLVLVYSFIFVIIQIQEFSLLVGSVGLFIIIASIMYFSRDIRWYADLTE
jgi:inner membrane protein